MLKAQTVSCSSILDSMILELQVQHRTSKGKEPFSSKKGLFMAEQTFICEVYAGLLSHNCDRVGILKKFAEFITEIDRRLSLMGLLRFTEEEEETEYFKVRGTLAGALTWLGTLSSEDTPDIQDTIERFHRLVAMRGVVWSYKVSVFDTH
jgi:hypothetical protein